MSVDELLKLANTTFNGCIATLGAKNHDYSKGEDALRNFKLCECMKLTDAKTGIMVRLCDKFARISNLLHTQGKVNEKLEDTIDDAINYLVLLKAVMKEKECAGVTTVSKK
jgi:hypothetical protein